MMRLQSVNQIAALTQRGQTPGVWVGDHRSQKLSQWHPHRQRECTAERNSHSVESKVGPVHPGSQERNNDPDRRNYHITGRAHNRVSRLANLPDWAYGTHNIAGFQAPPPNNVWNGAGPRVVGRRRPVNQDTPQGAPKDSDPDS
eukprot:6490450-Amphidinium_carterae.2